MANPIRLYVVRHWSKGAECYACEVFAAYDAIDALTQWRIESPGARSKGLEQCMSAMPQSIEPIDENDPRLNGQPAFERIRQSFRPNWVER